MKKKPRPGIIARFAPAGLTVTLALAASLALAAERTRLVVGHGVAPAHPFHRHAELFKEAVESAPASELLIEIAGEGRAGDDRQLLEAALSGQIDGAIVSSILFPLVVKQLGFVGLQLPFAVADYGELKALFASPAARALLDDLGQVGLTGVSFAEAGRRYLATSKRTVTTLSDMLGLRVRIAPIALHKDFWQAVGATPVSVVRDKLSDALKNGSIDGLDASIWTLDSEGLWLSATNVTLTGHYFWPGVLVFNRNRFEALSQAAQETLMKAGREVIGPQVDYAERQETEALKRLRDNGVRVRPFPAHDQARAAVAPLLELWRGRDARIDSILKFTEARKPG